MTEQEKQMEKFNQYKRLNWLEDCDLWPSKKYYAGDKLISISGRTKVTVTGTVTKTKNFSFDGGWILMVVESIFCQCKQYKKTGNCKHLKDKKGNEIVPGSSYFTNHHKIAVWLSKSPIWAKLQKNKHLLNQRCWLKNDGKKTGKIFFIGWCWKNKTVKVGFRPKRKDANAIFCTIEEVSTKPIEVWEEGQLRLPNGRWCTPEQWEREANSYWQQYDAS